MTPIDVSCATTIACFWALCAGTAAQAASFPCEGALTAVERNVCGDPEVSVLDEHLGRYHAAARQILGPAADCLVADQRAWLRTVRNTCPDTACLKTAYLRRLGELDGLQPGATAVKTLPLPAVPTLVWIIPAAADTVAAPRLKDLQPLQASGRLVNEVASGDGHVLQAQSGQKHLVVASMFIDASTEMLNSLVGQPGVRYQVRGQIEPGSTGMHFAQSSCRYVYRLPR